MNIKLILTTLILLGLAVALKRFREAPEPSLDFHSLSEKLELAEVRKITLRDATQATTLTETGDGTWGVAIRGNYPADLKKVSDLINDVTGSRILHRVASSAKHHERLGLLEPLPLKDSVKVEGSADGDRVAETPDEEGGDEKSFGHASSVTFEFGSGKTRTILLANPNPEKEARASTQGMNVRFSDEDVVYRLAKSPWITYDTPSWIEKSVPGFEGSEVRSISMNPGSTSAVLLTRSDRDAAFEIATLPEGQKLKVGDVSRLADAAKSLRIRDIAPADGAILPPGMGKTDFSTFELFDGRTYQFILGDKVKDGSSDVFYVKRTVSVSEDVTESSIKEKVAKESVEFEKWYYQFGGWTRTSLIKSPFELLESPASKENTGSKENPEGEPGETDSELFGAGLSASGIPEEGLETDSGTPPLPVGASSKQIGARHILIAFQGAERSTATRSRDDALKLASDLRKKISNGEKFEDLARNHSDGPSKSEGGDLGTFGKGQMVPAFEKIAWSLGLGEISQPVETPFGFHLILRTQ